MSGAGGARGGSTPAAPGGPCGVRYLRLPVLDRQLHRDPQPLPVARGLGDVIAHLLGGLRDDTWRSHRARIRAESPSAAPGFFSVCRTAEHPFCTMEQHRPRTYFIPPSQGPLQFPRDSLTSPTRTRFPPSIPTPQDMLPLRSGHVSSLPSLPSLLQVPPSPVRTSPRGPILGASADVAPTSPPVQRR